MSEELNVLAATVKLFDKLDSDEITRSLDWLSSKYGPQLLAGLTESIKITITENRDLQVKIKRLEKELKNEKATE